jgi:hypothetical protein
MLGWKIYPRVEEYLFLFLAGKITPHMWEREEVLEGRKCVSGASHTERSIQVFVKVQGFQWEQSRMYVGCNGNSRVHPV